MVEIIQEEYTPGYCKELEAAYGQGLMSEGGVEGIEAMLEGIKLDNLKAVDFGCGLGGATYYLSQKYAMQITGLDISPWVINQAQNQCPEAIKDRVLFEVLSASQSWPLPHQAYDIVYSKGVLTHIKDKLGLFEKASKVLKSKGLFVIVDWLSVNKNNWGSQISRLIELEGLKIHPETVDSYHEAIRLSPFKLVYTQDQSKLYSRYNLEIVNRLSDNSQREALLKVFVPESLEDAIQGYQAIYQAIESRELQVYKFILEKACIDMPPSINEEDPCE